MDVESKKYFDDVAAQWAGMRASFFSEAVRDKAFAVAGIRTGKLAADIGAGTGFVTEGLIQKGLKAIAVDHSNAMLTEMRRKLASFDGIDYRVGEAENLPIADATVDYVFANMCLHHVESPPKAIKEMVRVLRPDGELVITDMDEHTFEFLRVEQHDRWLGFKREDVKRWLVQADLRNVGIDSVNENCCAQSSSGDELASVGIFAAFGEKGEA